VADPRRQTRRLSLAVRCEGEFTCDEAEDKFLLLAAGCGVTPIMSMRRWLAKYRPQADVQVIFACVRRKM
jgi:ferredoxin-NADP reductase